MDRLPEIQSAKNRKENQPPGHHGEEKKVRRAAPVVIAKNLEESFKKNSAALDIIKEDRLDDEYCKYNDDFEPVVVEETKVSAGSKISKEIGSILDIHLNPKSAEPHLHKSKAKNL